MRSAAVLDDAHSSGGDLVLYAVIEENNAVCHVLFETVASQCPLTSLAGDDRRHSFFFQPAKQASQLSTNNGFVGQRGEECFERIEDDALRSNRIDRVSEAKKQSLEIVFAGLFDLRPLDEHVVEQ